jgi:putative addiction module component (TIGR02574 family)
MNISQMTIDEIKKLSLSEKILIIEEIWDSIVKDNEYPELTDIQREELNKRIDSYHANPDQGRTWDEIKNSFWGSK